MNRLKYYLKFIIPPVLFKIKNKFSKKIEFYSTICTHQRKSDVLIVLGNGPSLKQQLDKYGSKLATQTCVCVNSFVLTKYYEIVRPKIYLLVDPAYFTTVMLQDVATEIRSVWEKIIANTKWPLDLVIPSEYRQAKQIEQIKSNKYINVLFYNSVNCSDYNDKTKQFNLFNENKLAPPAQTVLNTAVYFGIFWRYKTIVLIGADTSWHKQIEVDQKTNMLYMKDAHFYGVNKRSLYKNVERTVPARIHEEFYSIARALEAYWLLREYAEFNSTTIYNASGKSYIDAFERKPLKTILAE